MRPLMYVLERLMLAELQLYAKNNRYNNRKQFTHPLSSVLRDNMR